MSLKYNRVVQLPLASAELQLEVHGKKSPLKVLPLQLHSTLLQIEQSTMDAWS